MRRMADSVDVANLPAGFDLYGAYVDGAYKNYAEAAARFPGKVVGIAVFSTTNEGTVGDCESGDMTPQTAVQWVEMRRSAGVDPTIYCSEALWPAVRQAFVDAAVPPPHYWIAGYPGSVGEALYPGSVAHQWVDRGPYDESVIADNWPGVDQPYTPPPPPPPPVEYPGDNMKATPATVHIVGGKGWIASPAPAASVVNVAFLTENPDIVGRYDNVPAAWSAATATGTHTPNGALVIEGMVPDGNYGVVVWSAS